MGVDDSVGDLHFDRGAGGAAGSQERPIRECGKRRGQIEEKHTLRLKAAGLLTKLKLVPSGPKGPLISQGYVRAEARTLRERELYHQPERAEARVDFVGLVPRINPRPTLKPCFFRTLDKAGLLLIPSRVAVASSVTGWQQDGW